MKIKDEFKAEYEEAALLNLSLDLVFLTRGGLVEHPGCCSSVMKGVRTG
jgi:hypothetical protein